jgi:CubicO group peptidase (beta-lactamase class C family)
MKHLSSLLAFGLLVACSSPAGSGIASNPSGPTSPDADEPNADADPSQPPASTACADRQAKFDEIVTSFRAKLGKSPGGALGILCKGSHAFVAGAGKTAKTGGTDVDGTTRFQLASMTKFLTAVTAVRLARNKVIDLEGPVSTNVPFANTQKPFDRPFTWSELLSHTAGFTLGFASGELDLEPRFRANGDAPLWSRPGAVFNYSNEGYALAGLGMQLAAKKTFADLVRDEVFAPAGMTRATMSASTVEGEANFAKGLSGGRVIMPTDGYLASTYYGPMGGAWASAEDLMKLAKAFMDGSLVTADERALMTKVRTRAWTGRSFGLGLAITEHEGVTQYSHSGSVGGYLANLDLFPAEGFAVAVLVNNDEDMPDVSDEAFAAFTGKQLSGPTIEKPKTGDRAEHLGTYSSPTIGNIVVSETATGALELTLGSLGKVPLAPSGVRDVYEFESPDPILEGYPDQAIFWRDAQGKVRHVVTLSGVGERP